MSCTVDGIHDGCVGVIFVFKIGFQHSRRDLSAKEAQDRLISSLEVFVLGSGNRVKDI